MGNGGMGDFFGFTDVIPERDDIRLGLGVTDVIAWSDDIRILLSGMTSVWFGGYG